MSKSSACLLCNQENRRIVLRSTSTNAPLGNPLPIVRVCPTPEPPPTPRPENMAYRDDINLNGGVFGMKQDRIHGSQCTLGYHRSSGGVRHVAGNGASGCSLNGWADSGRPDLCYVSVHVWADSLARGVCQIWVYEVGDELPAHPAPVCDCW